MASSAVSLRMSGGPLDRLLASHRLLAALGVPHGLIGGWGVIAWGRVRATRDIDWLAEVPAARRAPVLAGLAPLGAAQWRAPGQDDPVPGLIRVVPADDGQPVIDILMTANAADRAALTRCREVRLGGGTLPAVGPEDIISMKLRAGGPLDLEDAAGLLRTLAGRLDEALLAEACKARRVGARLAALRRH